MRKDNDLGDYMFIYIYKNKLCNKFIIIKKNMIISRVDDWIFQG